MRFILYILIYLNLIVPFFTSNLAAQTKRVPLTVIVNSYTTSGETTLAGALLTTDLGLHIYNSTTNKVRIWNGTSFDNAPDVDDYLDPTKTTLITAGSNYYNQPNYFVKLTSTGKYPALDGSLITNLPAFGGGLIAANNLSDVANATTSRNNLLPSKTGNSLKVLRVNAGETDYELASGNGDMLKSDNLSGLANYTTARSNLGLGTLATQSGTFSGTSSGTNTGDQDLSGKQDLDSDLTTIAGLTATTNNFLVSVADRVTANGDSLKFTPTEIQIILKPIKPKKK